MSLVSFPRQIMVDADGVPRVGCLAYFYLPTTTTPITLYTTSAYGPTQTNPVVSVAGGYFPAIYINSSVNATYKLVVKDSLGATLYTEDNIPTPFNGSADILALILANTFTNAIISYARTDAEIDALVTPTYYYYQPGDIRRYGAVLDGSTDDTAAVQRWATVGGNLTWPVASTAKVTTVITLVSNTTINAVAGATIRQYTANANAMSATSKSNIKIYGLTLQAVGSMSSYFDGQGLHVESCTNVQVIGATITGHRGWGIQFYNSTDCFAYANRLVSSPVTNADNHTQCAGDISLTGNSSGNIILHNWCISGNGIGVSIHELLSTDHTDNNSVCDNEIRNCKLYGAEVYQNDPAGTAAGNRVTNNTIDTVTGDVAHSTNGYIYGAGIYSVGSANTIISDNRIRNTHSGAVVFVDLLAPAAIGVTNCGKVTIVGNEIDTCGMYGIVVRDPGALGPTKQKTIVANNNISTVLQIGIQVLSKANVSITGNEIETTTSHGIHINNTVTKRSAIRVDGNTVKSAGGTGILAAFCTRASFNNNTIESPTVHGMAISDTATFDASGNKVFGHDVYGILIDTGCSNYTCDSNAIDGNSTGDYGIFFASKGNLSQTNQAINCTIAFAGTYNPRPAGTPGAGTWAVGDTVYFSGPSSGGNIGAVCTTAPLTFKTFGVIA